MKKFMLLLILSGFGISGTVAASDSISEIDKAVQTDLALWMNNEINHNEILDNMIGYDSALAEIESSWWSLYWQAQVALIQGQIYYELGEKRNSLRQLDRCLELAGESINIRDQSDSWRIMSEASSMIMLQKGMLYIIANFTNAQDQANRALEIDASNARASLVIGQFLCSAPPVAGGNFLKGMVLMDSLLQRDNLTELDRFIVFKSQSGIYIDKKMWVEAERTCRQALAIYPGNEPCRDMLLKIQEKREKK